MKDVYSLKVCTEFAAAHVLNGYDGPCSNLHGHNWKVQAEVKTSSLDEIGMGVDFRIIKRSLREYAQILDHTYLNEHPDFQTINPTAEVIAKWFYQKLQSIIDSTQATLHSITIWENDRSFVTYSQS